MFWNAKGDRKTHWITIKFTTIKFRIVFFGCLLCRFFSIFCLVTQLRNMSSSARRTVLQICYVQWVCLFELTMKRSAAFENEMRPKLKTTELQRKCITYLEVHGSECLYNIKKWPYSFSSQQKPSKPWTHELQWVNFPKIKCFGISARAKKKENDRIQLRD